MEIRKRSGINNHETKTYVFGVQPVLEVLRSEKDIEKILVTKEFNHKDVEILAKSKGVFLQRVPVEKLNRITKKNHQGILAFVSPIHYAKLSDVVATAYEKGKVPLVLLLDRITDVRNLGAISRTAEACGVDALVVPTRGSALINADAMKTSSGALNYIPVCRENDLVRAVDLLQQSGFRVFACTEKAAEYYFQIKFDGPTAIVMGSEEDGVSDALIQKVDGLIQIPMLGQVGSLNVSAASAVVLYEVVKQQLPSQD